MARCARTVSMHPFRGNWRNFAMRLTIGKDNVGDGKEAEVEISLNGRFHLLSRVFDTDGNHSDHDRGKNTDKCYCEGWMSAGDAQALMLTGTVLTGEGEPGNIFESPGDSADEADNHTDNVEDNGACSMASEGVQHHAEGQDMAAHDEDQEDQLESAEHFSPEPAQQDFPSIGHAVDMRVRQLELADHIARVRRDQPETDNQNDAA